MSEVAIPDGHAPDPVTGELLDLSDAPAAAQFIANVKTLEERLRELRRFAERTIVEESRRLGKKTFTIGTAKIVIGGGPATEYDVEILTELVAAGLPEERFLEVVPLVCEYKPKAADLKQLASANETYKAIIDRARKTVEKPHNVRINTGGA